MVTLAIFQQKNNIFFKKTFPHNLLPPFIIFSQNPSDFHLTSSPISKTLGTDRKNEQQFSIKLFKTESRLLKSENK